MGFLDALAVTNYAAKMERIIARRLGIALFRPTKRQRDEILRVATQARAAGFSAEEAVDICFDLIKTIGKFG